MNIKEAINTNIFLPYENDIMSSIRAMDDKRLNKQILETKQILDVALGKSDGYSNHPVTKWYINYPKFLIAYGYGCCAEYECRFGKNHKYYSYYKAQYDKIGYNEMIEWAPYYAEGRKSDTNHIRTTDNVSELFKNKLCDKWDVDVKNGRPPKWTNCDPPRFWKGAKE